MNEMLITEFDVMFALHTGVTIMLAKNEAFDGCENESLLFSIPKDSETAITVSTPKKSSIKIDGLKKEHVIEAKERGFIMIYEMEDDEITRCTPFQLDI
ncbi:MAG: hypothetical protein ACQEQL_04000 [Pseudomonadota bacterium]